MECFAAVRGPHAIDFYHDKALVGQIVVFRKGGVGLRDEGVLGTGIDVLDDRVFLARFDHFRTDDQSVNVGRAIASFSRETYRLVALGPLSLGIAAFEFEDQFAGARGTELMDRRHIDARIGIDEPLSIGRSFDAMIAVTLGQLSKVLAVEIHAAVVAMVRVLIGGDSSRVEPKLLFFLVDPIDRANDPRPLGNLVDQLSVVCRIAVQVVPTVAFAPPKNFPIILDPLTVSLGSIIDVRWASLFNQRGDLTGPRIDGQEPDDLMSTLVVDEQ